MGVGQRRRRRSNKALVEVEKPKEEDTRYVPEEIILNILPGLPLKSLLRFRCVSKLWSSLISQITTRVQKVLFRYKRYDEERSFEYEHFMFRSIDHNIQVEDIDMAVRNNAVDIHGSCNGLLLIRLHHDLCLWNSSIRRCVSYWRSNYHPTSIISLLGLFFDSCNDYYKIVMVWSDRYRTSTVKALVGSFKTQSRKKVEFPYEIEPIGKFSLGPLLNNHPHWLSRSPHQACDFIVYFDTNLDKFFDLPGPSLDKDERDPSDSLGVLDGCLCMARHFYGTTTTKVLIMEEYGVKESWTLLFKFEQELLCNSYVVPLFYGNERKREVLMLVRDDRGENNIAAYDMDKNAYKGKTVVDIGNDFIDPVVYEETVIKPNWRSKALSASKDEEKTQEHTRPMIVWNMEEDIIRSEKTKEEIREWTAATCSSVDVEQITTLYLERYDRLQL